MNYAQIRKMDISNGEGVGISLFVQGCHFHCDGCFNQNTWDFNGGKEWTTEVQNKFLELANKPYIKRISILGGEPLEYENLPYIYDLVKNIKEKYPDKKIWMYTGFTLNYNDFLNVDTCWDNGLLRNHILRNCDIVVDGRFEKDKLDLSLPYRGSSNQRLIDVRQTIDKEQIVLYEV